MAPCWAAAVLAGTADPLPFHASRIGEIAPFIARTPRRRFVQSIRKPARLSDTASDKASDNLYDQERRSLLSILKAPPKHRGRGQGPCRALGPSVYTQTLTRIQACLRNLDRQF